MRIIIFSLLCVLLLQTYSVRAQQAAQLTSPVQDANIDITNNISFKWNAAQVPDAINISYKVQVFEIGNSPVTQVKGSPVSFMNSQTPVWEAIQRKGLAASWPVPEKAVGKKYLWRVITLVGGQPRSFAVEMANYFYINSLTIKTDDVNKVITAEKKEVTFDNNNPPGRPKFPPQQKDTLPVNKPPSQTVASYTLTLVEPFNVSTIAEADSKYPIKFIWQLTPELNKNQDVNYRLRVYECIGTQTAQQAISNNPPVINKLSKRLNLVAELLPADAAGKKYAWTVEGTITGANGQKNIVVYADAWTFKVAKSGKEPGPKEPGTAKNKYTGPKLKYPNNGAELKAGAINNLQLSWEPVSPTPQQPLTYRWFVYEMQGGRSATDIVKNSNPVKQGTVKNTFFATINLPADAPGKRYAWTVQAVNDEGGSYGDNDGFADPFVFSVQSGGKATPPSNKITDCTPPILNNPGNGIATLKKGKSLEITGAVKGDVGATELKVYKISDDPGFLKKLDVQGARMISAKPIEVFDYKQASKKYPVSEKSFKINNAANANQRQAAVGNGIKTTLNDGDLEQGSYYVVFKNGSCESNPLPLSVNGNCDVDLTITNITDICLGIEGNMAKHKICFDVTYLSSTCALQFLNPGSGLKVLKSDQSANYTISGITPVLSSQPQNTTTVKSYCITVLIPPTESSVILALQGDACFTTPVICQPGVFESIDLKFCTCDYCDNIQWQLKGELPTVVTDGEKNWFINVNQSISLPGQNIKSFKAEIIKFSHKAANGNEECITCNTNSNTYGNFTNGQLTAPGWGSLSAVFPVIPNGGGNTHHTLNWFTATGTSTTMGASLNYSISAPPFSTLDCCDDEFSLCVRYTFTTADCKTCSKVVCYNNIKREHKKK